MVINITSGECLNKILQERHSEDVFIPFNEAMINGTYSFKLFSEEFMSERSKIHGVTLEEYKNKLKDFLIFLKNINKYEKIVLWFGDEPFCRENTRIVLEAIHDYGYRHNIILNIVNEENGNILVTQKIR